MTVQTRELLLGLLRDIETESPEALRVSTSVRKLFRPLGGELLDEILRVNEFTILLQFDLSCLFSDFIIHEHKPRAHVYARFLILTIHEAAASYKRLLGSIIRKLNEGPPASRVAAESIRQIHRKIIKVAAHSDRQFRTIRNGISAHRDAESVTHLERVVAVGGENLAQFLGGLLEVIKELGSFFSQFTQGLIRELNLQLNFLGIPVGSTTRIQFNSDDATVVQASDFRFHSTDARVASVDEYGVVAGISPGVVRVSFTSRNHLGADGNVWILVAQPDDLSCELEVWRAQIARVFVGMAP